MIVRFLVPSAKQNGDPMRNSRQSGRFLPAALSAGRTLCLVALCWLGCPDHRSAGQTNAPSLTADQPPYTNHYGGEYFTSDLKNLFRLRHIEGEGQAGVDAFTNFGFTNFVWGEQGVLMLDVGARITNDAEPGITGGVHQRLISGNVVFGAGAFYDWQDDFHQGALAFEVLGESWALRSNVYAVLGDDVERDSEYTATGATSVFFQENNIFADGLLLTEQYEVAMSGVDIELARYIGTGTELFVGGYYYDGNIGDDATGAKGGVRGFLLPDLAASISVSGDDVFGTNIYGGLTWFLGARGRLNGTGLARRLVTPVERNEQIVRQHIERTGATAEPVVLTESDDPITVVHVYSGAAGANEGTFEDPFDALPTTQEADIVFVHSGSVFVGQSYTVAAHQRFLGEGDGSNQYVETDEIGEILMPDGRGWNTRPRIQNAPGNAIILAAVGSEVSNFIIEDAVGNGIFGDGVTGFNVNRNLIRRSGGRGISLNNISGAADGERVATGRVSGNGVSNSSLQNIQMVLASDFQGVVDDNVAVFSATSHGMEITGPYQFSGFLESNIASNNFQDGLVIDVDAFEGAIQFTFAIDNGDNGMELNFGTFNGAVRQNWASLNGDNGIDFRITGNGISDIDFQTNTFDTNHAEGMQLAFSGSGFSLARVNDNEFEDSSGGSGREFFAQNEDALGSRPTVFIQLDGNTSTNALGAGPPFNYEFENDDLVGTGEMIVESGTNAGTVGIGEGVELGEFPE
jgi:hypothetical protein